MKKYLLIILFIFLMIVNVNVDVYAQASVSSSISAIENNFFGYEYKNESEIKRIERIEKHLYGKPKTGEITKRLENIQNDMGFTLTEESPSIKNNPNNINNPNNTPTIPKENINKKNRDVASNLVEDSSVDYPMVDRMEQEIFKTTYKNDNIYDRLSRLEQRIFNTTSDDKDLSVRVNNLASIIVPKKLKQQKEYTADEIQDLYTAGGLTTVNDQSLQFQLSALEEDILRNSYSNDNISNRLSRLENKLFSKTYSSDTDVTRLQRIIVAYESKKDRYKYENNKRMQNMATVSQLSGLLLMILAILL